ncbi:hypothetical protein ACFWPQ_08655 [Streptomyces sp. NPDC058464]
MKLVTFTESGRVALGRAAPGDVVECAVTGLGTLRNTVRSA